MVGEVGLLAPATLRWDWGPLIKSDDIEELQAGREASRGFWLPLEDRLVRALKEADLSGEEEK
jgi:hypothetical protein